MSAATTQRTRYFDLPPVRTDTRPAFVDVASCRRWLEELHAVPPNTANGLLYAQLTTFTNAQAHADTRFAVLELLRPRIHHVQNECAEKYLGKPLPLSPRRRETLSEVSTLWDALARGYQRCLEQWSARDSGSPDQLAAACERALDAVARKLREHHFAYVQVGANDFRLLHRLYQFAEKAGIVRHKVRDGIGTSQETTNCIHTYTRATLLDASMPREHRLDRLVVIEDWIDRWVHKVSIVDMPPAGGAVPLFVNLNRDLGARREAERGASVRLIDVSGVAQTIAKRIHSIRHGKKPAEIDLGDMLNQREAEHLLVSLHRQWREVSPRRIHERTPTEQPAHVSPGLLAAHFYVGRQPFTQPFQTPPPIPESADERVKAATDYLLASGIRAEQWIIRDESLTGLGLVRPLDESDDSRLVHGQLITIRRRGGGAIWVGTIQWLQEAQDGDLLIGARLVPGVPSAVAARRIGETAFFPALQLDPIPALNAPTSLIVPYGTFAAQRLLEVYHRGIDRLQLTGLLEAGADYERVAFMPVIGHRPC